MYTVNLLHLVHHYTQPFDPLSVPSSNSLVVLLSCRGSFTTTFTAFLQLDLSPELQLLTCF